MPVTDADREAAKCGDCIKLSECAYEFGAHPDDRVCTGFREPLRTTANAIEKGAHHD